MPRGHGFWNEERNELLREYWGREPMLSLAAMCALFGNKISRGGLRRHAVKLGLPARYQAVQDKRPPLEIGTPGLSETQRNALLTEALRPQRTAAIITYPLVTGCTFIDPHGDGSRCGKGHKQACAEHRERMAPIPKGPLGYMQVVYSATGGRIRSARVA